MDDLRFISFGTKSVKIHLHLPDDTMYHRNIGSIKIGAAKAIKIAIRLRNKIGKKYWGPHWDRVLNEEGIFERLPHSLTPVIVYKPAYLKSGELVKRPCYLAKWTDWNRSTKEKRYFKTRVFSIEKHGKLAAYNSAKLALLEGNKEFIPILQYMERFKINKHL